MTLPILTDDQIYEWVLLLESGHFEQARRQLFDWDGQRTSYCCLGVACLVHDPECKRGDDIAYPTTFRFPSIEAGIPSKANPQLRIPKDLQHKAWGAQKEYASSLNDSLGFTFAEIARCVRDTWPHIFED